MSEFLIFVITGLTAGAVYSLAGVGLVLTYKTSGVFNFAHGALATVSAYALYTLLVEHGWPWGYAVPVVIIGVGTVMGLLLEPLARRLRTASLPMQVSCTVGLLLAIEAVALLMFGSDLREVPQFLPAGGFELAGAPIQWSAVITLGFALVVTAALGVSLRTTRSGLAMRALVDDEDLLELNALNPTRVRRLAWVIGSMLAAASGVLFAPLLPLDPVQLTLLVVSAFGAAAIGRFTSLYMTFAGGLIIGVLASLATRYLTSSTLAGIPPSLPFIVLFVVILVIPKGRLALPVSAARLQSAWSAPARLQIAGGIVVIAVLATVPSFAGFRLTEWTTAVATIGIFLSLSLLVKTSGQVSLCHVTFAAIGACTFSHLVTGEGWPWFAALIAAGVIALPIGALLAIPAIRLSGLYLALATLGFGILVEYVFYSQNYMFGTGGNGLPMPLPSFGSGPISGTAFYFLVLAIIAVIAAVVVGLTRGRLGLLLRALGDAPTALETTGASTIVTRVLVFCLSAFIASLAGALIGVAQSTVSSASYPPFLSLTYLAVITVALGQAPWDALIAGLLVTLIPAYLTGGNTATYLQLIFGGSAVLMALTPASARGVPAPIANAVDRVFGPRRRPAPAPAGPAGPAAQRAAHGTDARRGLELVGIGVRFGGVDAVAGASLAVPAGRVTGLIGPNGAGKTTMFNACFGLVRTHSGTVHIGGREVSRKRPGARARAGLGRTFQDLRLFESLSVRDNVALGREGGLAGSNPMTHLVRRRSAARVIDAATEEALELCELAELTDKPVASLSTGQRRLVDLARCLAGTHEVLLLDEPSSGLDAHETERLGQVIRRVVRERGVGVLLVEHDLSLALAVCDSISVLEFGKMIYSGTPDEVMASPLVKAAYLGDAEPLAPAAGRTSTRPRRPQRPDLNGGSDQVITALARESTVTDAELLRELTAPALSLMGVTAGYGQTTVLRDVSLNVPRGSVAALLGPNGAGKTTLLRVAAGLISQSSGEISINGSAAASSAERRARAGLCLVPEGRAVFPNLSVKDNIYLQVTRERRKSAVDEVAALFPPLASRLNQRAGSMSGGQQQMLAMARCFLSGASIILLDELSMGLAPLVIDEIYQSVRLLADQGTALVIVEQYVDRALDICDELHVLARGELVFSGPPESLSRDELMTRYLGDPESGAKR
jgi:ABC-type branched-subunit amino acid transport system ATPase component/branched-subunit amino acid ABC-type transport system permease component